MFKVVRLFGVLFSLSLRRTATFRADLLFEFAVTLVGTSSAIAALSVVYTRTDSLAGWSSAQALTLLGTFQLVSGLRAAFVEPNVGWLGEQVKDGRFDALLLQPAPTIFLATLGTSAPLALVNVVLGGGIVAFGIINAAAGVTFTGVLAWLALLIAATAIMWATRALFAAIVFWAFGLSLDVVYDALWQFGRYPVQIYRAPLQLIFTYVFPVALISTVPVDALTGGAGLASVLMAIGVAAAACATAGLVWRAGLRRYTSATS
ncbi:MAG: viologen exporter family transport system permease protein [Kribbellaceae bacterium]|nr:viologen exporter family transport system permease protein [Kribbellaceae bacterium]